MRQSVRFEQSRLTVHDSADRKPGAGRKRFAATLRLVVSCVLFLMPFAAVAAPLSDPAVVDALMRPQPLPDQWIGRPDAPVTVIEYGPLNCVHCAQFWKDQFPRIKARYIDTGKVRLAFRDYPVNTQAIAAAMLARCAGAHRLATIDLLFSQRERWVYEDTPDKLLQLVVSSGMSEADARRCLADDALREQLQRGLAQNSPLMGLSLPNFFVNGIRYETSLPEDAIAKALGERPGQ